MIQRFYLKFRGNTLMILARTVPEAMEPWARINQSRFSLDDFENALIEPPNDRDYLILVGRTITTGEFLKRGDRDYQVEKKSEVVSEAPKEKAKDIENYFEV